MALHSVLRRRRDRDLDDQVLLDRFGLRFALPLRMHSQAVWWGGNRSTQSSATEAVDADGTRLSRFPDGDLFQAISNQLRVGGFNDATRDKGSLIEVTESNSVGLADYRDFSGASSWSATNITVGTDSIARIDGTTGTTNTLTADDANGTHILDLGAISSAAKVFSLWIQRKTGTGTIELTLDGGSTFTDITSDIVSGSWNQTFAAQTLANPDVGIRIVTSGDAVFVDWAQLEDGRVEAPGTPITGGATRTRDDLIYSSVGNTAFAMTIYCAYTPIQGAVGGSRTLWSLDDGTGNNRIQVATTGSDTYALFMNDGGSSQANPSGGGPQARGVTDVITAIVAPDDVRLFENGTLIGTPDTGATLPDVTNIRIGARSTGIQHADGIMAHFHIYRGIHTVSRILQNTNGIRNLLGLQPV